MSTYDEIRSVFNLPNIKKMLSSSATYGEDEIARILEVFIGRKNEYEHAARAIANAVANFDGVHSVRLRVKSSDSLCEKILRKESETREKVTPDNFEREITDLVGVRALYLYASDYYTVYQGIYREYSELFSENPCINYREGDDLSIFNRIDQAKRTEKKGIYRSIHYTINIEKIVGLKARAEIQTRTIYEEGWSEMNHQAYKGAAKDNEYIPVVSSILNRLVGTCNEMGMLMKQCETLTRANLSPAHYGSNSDIIEKFLRDAK